jgi:hypothetical protein
MWHIRMVCRKDIAPVEINFSMWGSAPKALRVDERMMSSDGHEEEDHEEDQAEDDQEEDHSHHQKEEDHETEDRHEEAHLRGALGR